jgi:hypothetical protein
METIKKIQLIFQGIVASYTTGITGIKDRLDVAMHANTMDSIVATAQSYSAVCVSICEIQRQTASSIPAALSSLVSCISFLSGCGVSFII